MKGLGGLIYLTRNAGKTLPLVAVIILAAMLVTSIVALIDSIPYSIRTIYGYTAEFAVIGPRGDPTQTPKILAKLKTAPVPIERTILCRGAGALVKSIVGKWPFSVVGLKQEDMQYLLKRQKVERIDGRLPKPGEPEVVISEPVARNLRLKIGSVMLGPKLDDAYSPKDVKVVGIAQTTRWLAMTDFEYLQANHFPPIDIVLACAGSAQDQRKLDTWATKAFKGDRAGVFTYEQLDKDTREMFRILYRILDVVIGILVLVITVMMGMLINIYQGQRVVEFGLLQALGYTKKRLVTRVLKETLAVVFLGWALGLLCGYIVLSVAKRLLMDPNAFAINLFDPSAYGYTFPIPLAILSVAIYTVFARFRRFDPVEVVERRLV